MPYQITKNRISENEPPEIMLIGASFNTQNLGVSALCSGAINAVFAGSPQAKIVLLDYGKTPATYQVQACGGLKEVKLVNIRFSKRIFLANNIALLCCLALCARVLPSKWACFIYDHNDVLAVISRAKIVGAISGGDSFSDIYGLRRLIYVVFPMLLAILMKKKLVLLPQSIGPFNHVCGKWIGTFFINRAWKVHTREYGGCVINEQLPKSAKEKRRLHFCYDMGFVLEPNIEKKKIPDWLNSPNMHRPLVGFNISGLLYAGGYNQKNMFGVKTDYRRLAINIIAHLIREHHVSIMLVPHVLGDTDNGESDVVACKATYNGLPDDLKQHVYLLNGAYNQHEIKAIIGKCDFFLGSRMHACIAALSQLIPAVGLAYSPKFQGLFASIGLESLVLDLKNDDERYILDRIDFIFLRLYENKKQLEKEIPNVKKMVLTLFDTI